MRRTTPLLTGAALGAALLLAAPGGAAPHGRGIGPGPGPGFDLDLLEERLDARADRLAAALDLTAAQRASFEALRTEHLGEARPQLDRMRELGAELRGLLEGAAPDAGEVGARVIELHGLREGLREARERFESELGALLTDEQRFAWRALREAGPAGGGGPRFGGGHFGPHGRP